MHWSVITLSETKLSADNRGEIVRPNCLDIIIISDLTDIFTQWGEHIKHSEHLIVMYLPLNSKNTSLKYAQMAITGGLNTVKS